MKKLYLHIGSHKTGTTSIQKSLALSSLLLEKSDISYFRENINGKTVENTSSWILATPEYHSRLTTGAGAEIYKPELLSKMLSSLPGSTIVMSAENFSWVWDKNEILRLSVNLKEYFDEIKIIIYIRRQDRLVISHHQQGSKSPSLPAHGYYSGNNLAIPNSTHDYNCYLDFYNKLLPWEDAFGIESIVIRVLEEGSLISNDVVADFFDLLGIKGGYDPIRVNESYGFERVKVGHIVNKVLPDCLISHLLRKGADNSEKFLPSRNDAMEFYNKYKDSNIRLNNKYQLSDVNEDIFDSDFSFYPEHARDHWDEDSANSAIENIFKSLSPLVQLKVDDLRDAAIAMEEMDLKVSFRLMTVAHMLRPQGKLISDKLDAYKKRLNF